MARPRKWESDAERMRAKRAELDSPRAPTPGTPEEPHDGERPTPAVRARIPSEEAYVAENVLATKLLIAGGLQDHDGKRVERAREYARQRYRGFLAGEVASL